MEVDVGAGAWAVVASIVVIGAVVVWRVLHIVTRRAKPSRGSSHHEDQTSQVMAQIDAHRGASETSGEAWDGDYRLETGHTDVSF